MQLSADLYDDVPAGILPSFVTIGVQDNTTDLILFDAFVANLLCC